MLPSKLSCRCLNLKWPLFFAVEVEVEVEVVEVDLQERLFDLESFAID